MKNFTGLTFESLTVTYNGEEHTLTVKGEVPSGASIIYTYNSGVDAGVYNATAIISLEGYNTLTLNATLTINKANFTGVTFNNSAVDYDGNEHTLTASGIPEGATVEYSHNKGTNAGVYNATATVKKANYNDLVLNATLTINKIAIPDSDITFSNATFEYDQLEHSISITGYIPSGVTVTYSGGENKNKATNVGKYTITAVIGGTNYIEMTLTAVLTIKSTEEMLSIVNYNGKIYFQNALDKNKLYAYDGSGLAKINNEKPEYFVTANQLYYFSPSLLSSGIASFDGTKSTNLFDVSGEYLTTDGANLYYAVSSIFNSSENGIYKISIADLNNEEIDPTPTRLTSVKAEYLVYANGYIYFSNNSDGGKLYRVSATANNASASLVYNYKVSDIIVDNNIIYFTRHFTLSNASAGAAIFSINVGGSLSLPLNDDASQITKITYSKGKYLVKAGEYIYFVNTDLVTSTIFGDGIYRAKADGTSWVGDTFNLLAGASRVVDGRDDNIYALSTDGTDVYYYRANNKHLYKYSNDKEIDLMEGFVPPVETKVITTYYSDMEQYKGELYYINMRDGGRLYKYSIEQDAEYRITGLQVADFAINGDYLYYSTVRLMTNFDLYRLHLGTGVMERISTEKCHHLAFTDSKIYYANFSGSNTLNSMNFDGTENTVLFNDKKVNDYSITIKDNKIYYVAGDVFYVWDIATSTAKVLNTEAKPNEYIIANDTIYFMNDKLTANYFAQLTLDGVLTNIETLGSTNAARSIFTIGDYVYYYRNVAAGSSNKGLYRVNITANKPTAELVDKLEGYYINSPQIIDGKVYFIDAWQVQDSLPTLNSTGKLCVLDLSNNTVEVLAE